MRVPAKPDYARVLRAVAGSVAVRADLPTDSLEDLELAVTEAAGALMADGTARELAVEFEWEKGSVKCVVATEDGSAPAIIIDDLRETVLRTLTSDYTVVPSPPAVTLTVAAAR